MALILCIFVSLLFNLNINADLETLPKDISEILEKLVEQIEDARKNKIYTPTQSINEQARDVSQSNVFENEGVTPVLTNNLKDFNFVENKKTDRTLKPGVNQINHELRIQDEVIEETSMPSRRNAPTEVDNINYPVNKVDQIILKNRVDDAKNSEQELNGQTRKTTSKNVNLNNITKLEAYFENFLEKIKDIQRLGKKEQIKLENLEAKYKSMPERDGNIGSVPLSNIILTMPKYHFVQDPYIVQRTPAFYQQLNPQRTLVKSSSPIRNDHTYREIPSIAPKIDRVYVRQFPLLLHNNPKFIWSLL